MYAYCAAEWRARAKAWEYLNRKSLIAARGWVLTVLAYQRVARYCVGRAKKCTAIADQFQELFEGVK